MKRLVFSLQILAAVAFGPAALVTSASAEIIPGCQWLTDAFPKHYVKKRANVRDAPNTQGNILTTLPPGSIVYTNEGTRNVEGNPETWYQVLATRSLPAWSGCSGGYIHPSLVSKTPPSTAEARWGVFIRVKAHGDRVYALAWNYPEPESALRDALKRCEQRLGIPCFPPRHEGGWYIPDLVFMFSTSASSEAPIDVGTHTHAERFRCILVYSNGNNPYVPHFANTEEELRDYFAKSSQEYLDYYLDAEPPTLEQIACNDS